MIGLYNILISLCINLKLIKFFFFRRLQIKENRKHLIPIVECIIMCGRQELALRGHRGETNKALSVNDG